MIRLLVVSLLAVLAACPPPVKGEVPKKALSADDKQPPAGDQAATDAGVPSEAPDPKSDKVSPPDQ